MAMSASCDGDVGRGRIGFEWVGRERRAMGCAISEERSRYVCWERQRGVTACGDRWWTRTAAWEKGLAFRVGRL